MAEQQHGSFDNALDRPKEFTLNILLFKYAIIWWFVLFIHLHLCEYCTGITHSYPLLIWRLCKYVGKIDKLFVRILIEDRGWVWVKPRIERQCIGMRKLNRCCAQETLSIFSLLAKLGQNCQCLLRMHHRAFLAKRVPKGKTNWIDRFFFILSLFSAKI